MTHGITAKMLILQNEDPAQFIEMMNAYIDLLRPSNQIEIDLVCDMVAARWRLRRIWRYQTALLDIEMDTQAPDFEKRWIQHDEDMRGGLAFASLANTGLGLNTTHRFEIHFGRVYRRAWAEFQKIAKRDL